MIVPVFYFVLEWHILGLLFTLYWSLTWEFL